MSQESRLLTKLWEILYYVCRTEIRIENLRVALAKIKTFELKQAFGRVARDPTRLQASDIFQFL